MVWIIQKCKEIAEDVSLLSVHRIIANKGKAVYFLLSGGRNNRILYSSWQMRRPTFI